VQQNSQVVKMLTTGSQVVESLSCQVVKMSRRQEVKLSSCQLLLDI
jgi:hypothetical protein